MYELHDAASEGFSADAEAYQHARPSYHPALVERFAELYGTRRVVDLGAGTGIFTACLFDAGASATAIEPVAAMRDELRQRLPTAEVLDGSAEQIPLDDESVDTVVAAQAFHWFDHAPALDEIARVLIDDGHLVTVWNVRDESVPWVAEYTRLVDRYAADTPRHRTMEWRRAIDHDERFTLVDDWHADHPVETDTAGVVARAHSTSFIARLPLADRQRLAADLQIVVADLGDRFDYPYRSELQAWRLDR